MPLKKLSVEQVCRRCDPASLPFETTAELEPIGEIFGQSRAMRALDFGVNIDAEGYNVFVIGPNGTGRMTAIQQQLLASAAILPPASDFVYVHNFANARAPLALQLKPGAAPKLRDALDALIAQSREKLPGAFDTEQYDSATDAITGELSQAQDARLNEINTQAGAVGLALVRTATGLDLTAAEQGAELTTQMASDRRRLGDLLDDALRTIREAERNTRQRLTTLDATVAESVVGVLVRDIIAVEGELVATEHRDAFLRYLAAVKDDLVGNIRIFKPREEPLDPQQLAQYFNRFRVNVFVTQTNNSRNHAPVVIEDNPTYHTLLGRIDRTFTVANNTVMAANTVDHMMLRPGAIHMANGGYLVLGARDLLDSEGTLAGLKRTLRRKAIRFEEIEAPMIGVPSLEPQPIPLDVKIVIHGNGAAYWEASARDEIFRELFKVKAEFVSLLDRTPESELVYARFLRAKSAEENLPAFERDAAAWLVEFGSRQADDQKKLSARFGELSDVIREAAFWAKRNGHAVVLRADMQQAVDERRARLNRYEDDYREYMLRGGYHVETSGEEVGQINGMSVLDLGEYEFGKPARITARSYVMRGGINDVDRAVNYTDQSHNKGIAIIDSYLSGIYSTEQALSVSANVVFEQSLSQHEGDSASCAILLAMLSSVSQLPIPQTIAVTGTLDQSGFVRPIGGTNTKIEGFFDMCVARGLNGHHGVVIPMANGEDLMLRDDVVEAVRAGKFHVFTASHVDDLIELYFGMPAGRRAEDGRFPPGTLHALVDAVLRENNEKIDGRRRANADEKSATPEERKPDGEPLIVPISPAPEPAPAPDPATPEPPAIVPQI